MMKKVNIVMKATHNWTQEDEQRLTARLVDNFYDLINRNEEEGLYWTGLQCDLVELAHIVWTSGKLMDRRGFPMDFQTIVHHICRVLHVREPRNPSSILSSVRARKNIRVGAAEGTIYAALHESKRTGSYADGNTERGTWRSGELRQASRIPPDRALPLSRLKLLTS